MVLRICVEVLYNLMMLIAFIGNYFAIQDEQKKFRFLLLQTAVGRR